jgi:amino acid transporter
VPRDVSILCIQGLLAFLFIASGDIKSLIAFSSFLIWMFYALAMVALVVMRKTKADANRPFKVSCGRARHVDSTPSPSDLRLS